MLAGSISFLTETAREEHALDKSHHKMPLHTYRDQYLQYMRTFRCTL